VTHTRKNPFRFIASRFGEMKIQFLLTMKNPLIKMIVVIAQETPKKNLNWEKKKLYNINNV